MAQELRSLLEAQHHVVPTGVPWVLPRPPARERRGGTAAWRQLTRFDKSWRIACMKSGLGTLVSEKPRKIVTPRLPQ